MSLWDTVNKVCKDLPTGYIIKLGMENGSAWIECYDYDGNEIELPDSTDKSLQAELNDALVEAKLSDNRLPDFRVNEDE